MLCCKTCTLTLFSLIRKERSCNIVFIFIQKKLCQLQFTSGGDVDAWEEFTGFCWGICELKPVASFPATTTYLAMVSRRRARKSYDEFSKKSEFLFQMTKQFLISILLLCFNLVSYLIPFPPLLIDCNEMVNDISLVSYWWP